MRLRRGKEEGGVAAVEFALILSFFVLLVMGSFELARAWNVHNVMDHAAREGARFAATESWEGDEDRVKETVMANLDAARVGLDSDDVSVVWVEAGTNDGDGNGCDAPSGADNRVLVCVTFEDYGLNFVFFRLEPDLRATAIARHES